MESTFKVIQGVKIFDGLSHSMRERYRSKIFFLKNKLEGKKRLFSSLYPSTLTGSGTITGLKFKEEDLIKELPEPHGNILHIGCNFGEMTQDGYLPKGKKETSSKRGRKPKPKPKRKRKMQGTGKYFTSQITFHIRHPDTEKIYKIKLFRNGSFQVGGVTNPDMKDLIAPMKELTQYLTKHFKRPIEIGHFQGVMRNYKANLLNENYYVDIAKLEKIIFGLKNDVNNNVFVDKMLSALDTTYKEKILDQIVSFNPINIAEMTYNTDRCFSLIIKCYRPNLKDPKKKVTLKFLKKGKLNFDGGNSQLEIEELYHWVRYIYHTYKDEILVDVNSLEEDSDLSDCSVDSIYDEDLKPKLVLKKPGKKKRKSKN